MNASNGAPVLKFAETQDEYEAFGQVCRAYADWCRGRYADMAWFVEEVFGHQSLDVELSLLASKYGPPIGRTVIALDGQAVVAGGAYRRRSDTVCEMKRLFVTDQARGHGVGRRLAEALIEAARQDGYATIQLDTAERLTEAIALYRSLGFEPIPAYQQYPERLMPHIVFMQRDLQGRPPHHPNAVARD